MDVCKDKQFPMNMCQFQFIQTPPRPIFLESHAKRNSTTMIFNMGVAARLDYFNNLIIGNLHKPTF